MGSLADGLAALLPGGRHRSAIMGMALSRNTLKPSVYVAKRKEISAELGLPKPENVLPCGKCDGEGFIAGPPERLCEVCDSLGYLRPSRPIECRTCKGAGFVRSPVTNAEHPDFGRAISCPTCAGSLSISRVARVTELTMREADIPSSYRGFTFESFLMLDGLSPSQKFVAGILAGLVTNPVQFTKGHDGKIGLLMQGGVGVGKTGLAIASMETASNWAGAMRFVNWPRLLTRIRGSYQTNAESEHTILSDIQRADLLVLDDFGIKGVPNDFGTRIAEQVIEGRTSATNKWTLITTNLTDHQIAEEFGARVASRLSAGFIFVEVLGSDQRRKA